MNVSKNLLALAIAAATAPAGAASLELVSQAALPALAPPNGASANASASADLRYVVFDTYADNLVAGDTNGRRDVVLFDRVAGTRVIVSNGGNGDSYGADITADGARIVFTSDADNLVPGDSNGASDVFVYERTSGLITRLVPGSGAQPNGASRDARISADGTRVAFVSAATNWLAGDTNGVDDVYAIALGTGTVLRASVAGSGAESAAPARAPDVSADGACVSFESVGGEFVGDDFNGKNDMFMRDLGGSVTERLSTRLNGTEASAGAIAGSSRLVTCGSAIFQSYDDFLGPVEGNTAGVSVYVRDVATTLVRWAHGNNVVGGPALPTAASADGQWLLVGADPVLDTDPALLRIDLGTLASTTLTERYGKAAAIANDGAGVLAQTARPARTDDRNTLDDVVVLSALVPGTTWLTTRPAAALPQNVANGASGRADVDNVLTPGAGTRDQVVSADGRYVAFSSLATNLVGGDTNGVEDVFVRDRTLGSTIRVSLAAGGMQLNGFTRVDDMSADGRFLALESCATNLVANDTNGICDVFLLDRNDGSVVRVNVSDTGTQANLQGNQTRGHSARVSDDGRHVVFASRASLVAGQTGTASRVYRRDVVAGTTELIGSGRHPAISSDGLVVARTTGNVIVNVGGVDTIVSNAPGGAPGDGFADFPSMSDDGRYVAFSADSTNLVADDANGAASDVFVHDRMTGETRLVSRPLGAASGTTGGAIPGIAGDGGSVAYVPGAGPDGRSFDPRGIRVDLVTGATEAFVDTGTARAPILRPRLGADGTIVVFAAYGLTGSLDPSGDLPDVYVATGVGAELFGDDFEGAAD